MNEKNIFAEHLNYLKGHRQRSLMTEKEYDDIDSNLVDIPPLKRSVYCFEDKRFCDKTKGRFIDEAKDEDLIANSPEIMPLIKKAVKAWNYYLQFKLAKRWPTKDKESGFVTWHIKKYPANYTEKDVLDAKLLRAERLHIKGRQLIGITTKDGKIFRYLLKTNDNPRS